MHARSQPATPVTPRHASCRRPVARSSLPPPLFLFQALNHVIRYTWITGAVLTFVLLIFWPVMALPAMVFSEGYFT